MKLKKKLKDKYTKLEVFEISEGNFKSDDNSDELNEFFFFLDNFYKNCICSSIVENQCKV